MLRRFIAAHLLEVGLFAVGDRGKGRVLPYMWKIS
jgi:hypothetical protein